MKRLSLLLILIFAFSVVWSQQTDCNCTSADDYQTSLQNGLIGIEYINPVAGYEGNQYLRDWSFGEVELNNGDVIKDIILRYDRFSDELLWLRKSDYKKGILQKKDITAFKFYDHSGNLTSTFIRKRVDLPWMDEKDRFLQILLQDKISLYVFRNVKEEPVEYKLMDHTRYFVSTRGNDYLILLKRKSLLNLPFINKDKMKKILRSNRLGINNNEQGLTMAISLYNQLPE
jgi:hypothetical protein